MVADLASLPAVYHEQDPKASSQNVIMFPRGYEGKQIYFYLNKTGEDNILDLCEVEILGCTGSDENCKCPVTLPEELPVDFLETEVAFGVNNNITLQCHSHYILLQNSSGLLDECNFQTKCKKESDSIQVKSVSYRCLEVCRNDAYNESTTVLVDLNSSNAYYLKEENITLQCKYRHKLIIGQLTRTCLGNLTWTGDKPVCQRCQCPCERLKTQNFITDPQVLEERIEEIKAKLEVEKAKLSSTIRQKTSASDERKSVQGIGMALGVGVITFIFSIIICSDLPLLYRHIRYGAL
ncbi:uncharacterized protein LOC130046855 [Ostrea edulis]|uniref:uncharacterized protein LOC130046855 n=1 Tax=Ostrea edulis TaxID=37623 RepID=UPI0024AF0F28|nr:uncharacterized protein LOC130046855 [Ostrea edulis]